MNLLIVPDIFGPTPALAQLARDLPPGQPPVIFDPYGGGRWFQDEDEAYAWFTRHLGVPAYARNLARFISARPGPWVILAFSAGASAVWRLAGTASCTNVVRAVCFYGSQIRHDRDLVPGFDLHLIFPRSEPGFDVDELISQLASRPRVSWEKTEAGHGFMNAYSKNFAPGLCASFVHSGISRRLTGQILLPLGFP